MIARVLAVAVSLLLLPLAAAADGVIPGPVTAIVISVYDGDTFTVDAALWPGIVARTAIRVDGVDTPELRARCAAEKALALKARDFTRAAVGERVELVDVRRGKYAGRMIARVRVAGGADLAQLLIAAGLGRPYAGGRRRPWCP